MSAKCPICNGDGRYLAGNSVQVCPCREANYRGTHVYREAFAEGRKLGREEERAAILAWLRETVFEDIDEHTDARRRAFKLAADGIELGDHLRPDIKDGEGK